MKIVLVNDQLNAGGAERVLVNMANLLYKHNVEVSVLLFLGPSALDEEINKNIQVVYLNRKSRFDFAAMRLMKAQLKNADIIHIHSRYNLRYYLVAKYLTGAPSKKIAFHEHVPDYKKMDAFTAFALRKVDAYIGVQERLCSWVKERKLVAADKVFFLPNIVSKPTVSNVPGVYKEKSIVMVANFRKIKNQLFALDILSALGKDHTLDLYGMIDEDDYYQQLLQYIKTRQLDKQVNIKTGVTNVYKYLPKYHFALHTATNETGPLVLLEYMNCGLPFFTYNTGEVVNNAKAALPELILDTLNVHDWVQRIKAVITKKETRHLLQHKMETLVSEKYSEDAYWKSLEAIYTRTLAN